MLFRSQADVRDAKLRLVADELITLRSTLNSEVADETALRQRRSEVEQELDRLRNREVELDRIALEEGPLLSAAQDNYYNLTSQREKLRGTQNLASERARFLAEEAEEARSSGRDPFVLEAEARELRNEEQVLRNSLDKSRQELTNAAGNVANLESKLKSEEDRIAASLRALADFREGTARQEGHIKSLQSRISSSEAEIARLERALEEAKARLEKSRAEFAALEADIAGINAGELTLDAEFQRQKSALEIGRAHV